MKSSLFIFLWVLASMTCFGIYCYALIDWVVDYKTGLYDSHHAEAFIETLALVIYTIFGLRFMMKRINLF